MLAASLVALLLLGCAAPRVEPTAQRSQPPQGAVSYVTAKSLEELVNGASVVVVGRVTGKAGKDKIFNQARSPIDPKQESTELFVVGQIYYIEVERYIKGSGEHTIEVVQSEGAYYGSNIVTPEEIERVQATSTEYVPLKTGARYLMFLRPSEGVPEAAGTYHDFATPSRFILGDDGEARPETAWRDAAKVFPPRSTQTLLDEVAQLAKAGS